MIVPSSSLQKARLVVENVRDWTSWFKLGHDRDEQHGLPRIEGRCCFRLNSMAYFCGRTRSSGATPSRPVSRSSTLIVLKVLVVVIILCHQHYLSQKMAARTTMRSSCTSCVV